MAGRANFPPTARGYDVRLCISAFQKAVRRSDPHQALYWAYEVDKSGYGNWIWKRIKVICSEDIGPAAPGLAADVRALYENWVEGRKNRGGEEILYLTHAVVAIATAPKSRVVDWAVWHHSNDYVERLEIPDEAYDRHTLKGRRQGRNRQHFIDEASKLVQPAEALGTVGQEYSREMMLGELEEEYRRQAQLRVDHEEHKKEGAAERLAYNPWEPPDVDTTTGEVLADDRAPAVHRLPGMEEDR